MRVVEFDPDKTFALVVHDGPLEMHARATLEPVGDSATRFTATVDIPAMVTPIDPGPIQASLDRMKQLIESET